jgi:Bacterial Ig-like domain
MRNWMLSGCAVLLASMLTACPPTTKTKPVISAFTATPSTVTAAGTDVKLDWTVTDAEKIAISASPEPGSYDPPANTNLTTPTTTAKGVKVTTTFTLTATNTTGVTTKEVTVTAPTTVGPTIVSSVPADAATGVAINSTIAVTFSAAMDKTLTQAAFTSSSVTTPTFAWTNGDKTLTITSSAPLNAPVAAPGTNKTVSYSFAATAKDAAGAALTSTAARTFVTQKAVKATIAGAATLSGNIIFTEGTGDFNSVPPCATPCAQNNYDPGIQAGDSNGFAGTASKPANPDFSYKGFAGFDITSVPITASLISATVSLTQANFTGLPYTIIAGGLKLQSITNVDLATVLPDAAPGTFLFYTADATKEFVLSTDDVAGVKSVAVTTAVAADLAGRATFGNRSLFRLIFPTAALGKVGAVKVGGAEDIARFNTPSLEVVYSQP